VSDQQAGNVSCNDCGVEASSVAPNYSAFLQAVAKRASVAINEMLCPSCAAARLSRSALSYDEVQEITEDKLSKLGEEDDE